MQTPLAIKMRACRVLEKSWDWPKFPNYCVPSDLYRTRCHKQARPPPSHDALAEMAIGEETRLLDRGVASPARSPRVFAAVATVSGLLLGCAGLVVFGRSGTYLRIGLGVEPGDRGVGVDLIRLAAARVVLRVE